MSAQAHSLFAQGKYFPAAQAYAQNSVTFEEVALKFLDVGERDALRSYLISRLERTRKTDLTQRMMLATWLVEFYLSKCNELDDVVASESVPHDVDNLQAERAMLEDDLRNFFEIYKVRGSAYQIAEYSLIIGCRTTWITKRSTSSFRDMVVRICICTLQLLLATLIELSSTTSWKRTGQKQLTPSIVR